jgi:hypothetical protein
VGGDERTGTAAPETHGVLRDRTARERKGATHGDGQEERREEERCEAAACQEDRGAEEDHGKEERCEAAPGEEDRGSEEDRGEEVDREAADGQEVWREEDHAPEAGIAQEDCRQEEHGEAADGQEVCGQEVSGQAADGQEVFCQEEHREAASGQEDGGPQEDQRQEALSFGARSRKGALRGPFSVPAPPGARLADRVNRA